MHKETRGKSKLRNGDHKNSTDKKKNTHIQKKKDWMQFLTIRQYLKWKKKSLDMLTSRMDIAWANSRRWWRTGKPVMPQSMRSQRVRHDWATEQQEWILQKRLDEHKEKQNRKTEDNYTCIDRSINHQRLRKWSRAQYQEVEYMCN